jgi:hypothetical protein
MSKQMETNTEKITIALLGSTMLLWATPSVTYAETFNYSCEVERKTYPLRADDTKNILEWRGKKYSLTVKEDCGRYGWHAEGNGTSFDFCTATQGYAAIEDKDGNDQVQCELKR